MKQEESHLGKAAFWPIPPAGVVIALGLALGLRIDPGLLYACTDGEYLNVLFARGYFSSLLHDLLPSNALPLQQINLPIAGLIAGSQYFSFAPILSIGASMAVLGFAFVLRYRHLFLPDSSPLESAVFVGLFLIHPYLGRQLIVSPGSLLCALLVMEFAIRSQRSPEIGAIGLLSLFVLSLSACSGFVWAAMLAISIPLACFDKIPRASELPWRHWALSMAPIIPAAGLYGMLTLQLGQRGGARLADYPTLFSEFSFTALLRGEWAACAAPWLAWVANGFLISPVFFPLLGILALLGLVDGWRRTDRMGFFCRSIGLLFLASLFLFPFLPLEESRQMSAPLFPLLLFSAWQGMRWIARAFHIPIPLAAGFSGGILAIYFLLMLPSEWNPVFERARYYQTVFHNLEREIDPRIERVWDASAIRFDPVLFARLPSVEKIYPIGLSVECPVINRYGYSAGVFFDLRFAPAPSSVVLFPRYDEISHSSAKPLDSFITPRVKEILEKHYQPLPLANFILYRRLADPPDIIQDWLASAQEEGSEFETRVLPGWIHERFHAESSPPLFLSEESLPQPTGMNWTFERDFRHTRSIGSAFGFRPTAEFRASGLRGAGSGEAETKQRLGILQSVPFVIEGGEMSFFADMPQDSTSAFFCLAVYERIPFGEKEAIKQTRHLFERRTGESLMGDTFFYILPQHIRYWPGEVHGWRVVRLLQETDRPGWQFLRWSLDPWLDRQAVWLAADRDPHNAMKIDQIVQWKRAPGWYQNFERGTYDGWQTHNEAFGGNPAAGPYGEQRPILGFEGNFFVNSYSEGSDNAIGALISPPFLLSWNRMRFLIGGGNDPERLYLGLQVDGETVLRATGNRSETLREVVWDISPWMGKTAVVEIVDRSSKAWGHILVDNIRIDSVPVVKAMNRLVD